MAIDFSLGSPLAAYITQEPSLPHCTRRPLNLQEGSFILLFLILLGVYLPPHLKKAWLGNQFSH